MTRGQNFFYQDNPADSIGQSLATAWFGDPAKAQEQQRIRAEVALRDAQAAEARAHGGLYSEQTRGYQGQNNAAASLPELFQNFQQASAPPDPAAPHIASVPPLDKGAALAALIAGMGQVQGDKLDPTKLMGAYGAFGGDEVMARRGMVAQGTTPGENFALTPQRADDIRAQQAAAKLAEGVAVARTNHATDIPVANIQAGAHRYAADQGLKGTMYTADSKADGATRGMRNNNPGNLEYGDFAKSMGASGSDGRFAIFPDYQSGVRAQEALLSGKSYLGGGLNTIDAILARYAPPGENPTAGYSSYVSRVTGIPSNRPLTQADIPVVAAAMRQFESGGGTAAVLKTAGTVRKLAAPTSAAKLSKPVSAAATKKLNDMLSDFETAHHVSLSGQNRLNILGNASSFYLQSGNMADAINRATSRLAVDGQHASDRDSQGNGSPMQGARKAPDGKWYVQTGANADGTPAYSVVESDASSRKVSWPSR